MCPQEDTEDDGRQINSPSGCESYVSRTCIPHAVSLQIVTLAGSLQNAMAACEASQISYTSTKNMFSCYVVLGKLRCFR